MQSLSTKFVENSTQDKNNQSNKATSSICLCAAALDEKDKSLELEKSSAADLQRRCDSLERELERLKQQLGPGIGDGEVYANVSESPPGANKLEVPKLNLGRIIGVQPVSSEGKAQSAPVIHSATEHSASASSVLSKDRSLSTSDEKEYWGLGGTAMVVTDPIPHF